MRFNKVLKQENEALQQEIMELKDKLQQAEDKIQAQMRSTCCHTKEKHQKELINLQMKYEDQIFHLNIKYEFGMRLAELKLEQAETELKKEKHLRFESEYEKLEALEITQALSDKLQKLEISKGCSERCEMHNTIRELQEKLEKERELRLNAETETFEQLEALFEEMDKDIKREQDLRIQVEAEKQKATEIIQILFNKLKDIEKRFQEGSASVKLDDLNIMNLDIQQLEEELQENRKVGLQAEKRKLKETQSTSKEVDQKKLQHDIQQLETLLQEEKRLRLQAETEISNHVESVSALCQELNQEVIRVRASLERSEAERLKAVEKSQTLLRKLELRDDH
ncbi:COP1-interactive protein 1-like [Cyprinodon tularosa]|uniref:COP1-interactive protein 1-like n=1 Tax=Cyprinodon tularosa TaxID=77115 RepID=UPI0018E21B4F|nr:COP1-interactive protein 1-like [Cyprinodon tularosa]